MIPTVVTQLRFSLESPVVPIEDLANDLESISLPEDPTPLAVLALRGLKEVRIDSIHWDLDVVGTEA